MNKLYLLPVSLLLLNPAFAEDMPGNALSPEANISSVAQAQNEVRTEGVIAEAEKPAAQNLVIEIDPKLLEELQEEIAAMMEENVPLHETAMVDSAIENEIAALDEPKSQVAASFDEEEEYAFDQEEVAYEEDEYDTEEAIEVPRKAPRKQALAPVKSRSSQHANNTDEQLAEKEPGSHVRRYQTKPSQTPRARQEVAESDYEQPIVKKQAPKAARSAKAPQVRENVGEAQTEQQQQKSAIRKQPSQSAQKAQGQSKQQAPVKRQPQAKAKTPEAQIQAPQAKQAAPAQRKTPAAKPDVRVEAPKSNQQAPGQRSAQATVKSPEAQIQAPQSKRAVPAAKPDVRVQAPKSSQQAPAQRSPQANAQAPSVKPQPRQRAPLSQTPSSVNKGTSSAQKQSAPTQQQATPRKNKVAQDESQGQMNSQGTMNSQGQMNAQPQTNNSGSMNSAPQAPMKKSGQTSASGIMYNTAARPVVKGGANLWIMGDALLWQAVEENLTYVYSGDDTSNQRNRDFHTVDFNWDWGFRLGAGYNIPRDGWDLDLYWTHIRNTASGSQHAHGDDSIFQIWGVAGHRFNGIGTKAKADWEVHLDQVDLELGRQFFVGKFLTIRPFVGARSDWIFQEYNVEFEGIANQGAGALEQKAKLKNRFWGFGFVAGLDTDWKLGWDFSIYGNADMSILMSFFDIDQKGTENDVKIWSQEKAFRTGRAILDLALGLKWSRMFASDRFGLTLKAGYEYHQYFNQNQFVLSSGFDDFELFNPVKGDLTYQGVTGSVQFDF